MRAFTMRSPADQQQDPERKYTVNKSLWIVFCLALSAAGLIGQMTTFGADTNATYTITANWVFKVGKIHESGSHTVTAVFLSDNTCSMTLGLGTFSGDYTERKNGVKLTFGDETKAAIVSNAVAVIEPYLPAGVTAKGKNVKFSKIKLKDGAPVKASDVVTGKLSETVRGKVQSRPFTLKTVWTDWVLTSGSGI